MPVYMATDINRHWKSGNMGRISLNIYCKSSHRSSQAPWPDSQAVYFFQHFFFHDDGLLQGMSNNNDI